MTEIPPKTIPQWTVPEVGRADFVRFAGAIGDFNPIHYDDTFAAAAGYPSVFGHGMFVAGLIGAHLTRWAGIDATRSLKYRFRKQLWPGDTITVGGEVLSVAEGLATCRVTAHNQNGDLLVEADAVVELENR